MTSGLQNFLIKGFSAHGRETASVHIVGDIGIVTRTTREIVLFLGGQAVPVNTKAMALAATRRMDRLIVGNLLPPSPQIGVFHDGSDLMVETLNAVEGPAMIGGALIQDPDICPKCGVSFEATGGKPSIAPYICQRCHAEALSQHPIHTSDGEGVPTRQGLAFGSDVVRLEFPPCPHDTFTAVRGHPETARCDACGEPPRTDSDYGRVRIRYVKTFAEMMNFDDDRR